MELTFLEEDQIFGENKLEIFKKRGTKAAITDFAILLGGFVSSVRLDGKASLKDRTGYYWTKTDGGDNDARAVYHNGVCYYESVRTRHVGCRPVLMFSSIDDLPTNAVIGKTEDGLLIVEYGYLPKWTVSKEMQEELESVYEKVKVTKAGDGWTTDSRRYYKYSEGFSPMKQIPYEYNGKIYSRVKANLYDENTMLSNGVIYNTGDYVWVEVEPIRWIGSGKDKAMIPEEIILGGLQFNMENYKGDFEKTNIYKYLNTYLIKEMFTAIGLTDMKEVTVDKNSSKVISTENLSEKDKLVKQILDAISKLSSNGQVKYKNELNLILEEYESKKESLRPSFNKEMSLGLTTDSSISVKAKLLSDLELLLFKLNSKTARFSEKINNSIKFVNGSHSDEDVFVNVTEIMKVLNVLDGVTRKMYKAKLLVVLEIYQKKAKNMLEKKQELTLDSNNEQRSLELELSRLLDEINTYVKDNLTVISELLNVENINDEEGNSLLKEKYLFLKDNGVSIEHLLIDYNHGLLMEDDKTKVISDFYAKLDSMIHSTKIDLIKKNIANIEKSLDVVEVENSPHSFEVSFYLGIQSFIKDIVDYVSNEDLEKLDEVSKTSLLDALNKTILECNEIINSDAKAEEKLKLVGAKAYDYQTFASSILDYNRDFDM